MPFWPLRMSRLHVAITDDGRMVLPPLRSLRPFSMSDATPATAPFLFLLSPFLFHIFFPISIQKRKKKTTPFHFLRCYETRRKTDKTGNVSGSIRFFLMNSF